MDFKLCLPGSWLRHSGTVVACRAACHVQAGPHVPLWALGPDAAPLDDCGHIPYNRVFHSSDFAAFIPFLSCLLMKAVQNSVQNHSLHPFKLVVKFMDYRFWWKPKFSVDLLMLRFSASNVVKGQKFQATIFVSHS